MPLSDIHHNSPVSKNSLKRTTVTDRKNILSEMIEKQIRTNHHDNKLGFKDMHRIAKYVRESIFGDTCCIWNGYVTNLKNITKGTYVNFYFKNKKVALHRLLYNNFVERLDGNEYLKFSCSNRGKCCNVNHMIKYKYNISNCDENISLPNPVKIMPRTHSDEFIIRFD